MAEKEENILADEKAEEVEEVKKGPLKKLIVIAIAVLVLAGGGFAGWKFFLAEKISPQQEQAAEETAQASTGPGIMVKVEPFIVNLLDQGGKRYLKTEFEIEVDNEAIQKELESRIPQLRDAILLLLTGKTFAQIGIPAGKVQLRAELIERINSILTGGAVRNLYFVEFVVQ